MTTVDLTKVDLTELLAELARRAGGTYQPKSGSGRMRYETKEAWAAAQAEKYLQKHNAEFDPSVRAALLGEVEKYRRMQARYKAQRI